MILGRPAPAPTILGTKGQKKLSPAFVEWMQGYPEGWLDGLTENEALRALGNSVVPQQALAALHELAPNQRAMEAAACA